MITTFTINAEVEAVALSADAQYIAAGDRHGRVWLWRRSDGKKLWTSLAHHGAVTTLSFHPTANQLASGGQDGAIRVWDIATGRALFAQDLIIPNTSFHVLSADTDYNVGQIGVEHVTFSPTGEMVVAAGADGHIIILHTNPFQVALQLRGHPVEAQPTRYWDVYRVAVSPDGRLLASQAFLDDQIMLWDVHNGQLIASLDMWYTGSPKALAFSADSQNIITLPSEAEVQIWSPHTQRRLWTASGMSASSIALSDDRTVFARGGPTFAGSFTAGLPFIGRPDTRIYLSRLQNPVPNNREGLCAIPSSPDQTSVPATACPRITPFAELRGHRDVVSALAYSRTAGWLVSGSWDKTVRLWATEAR